MFLSETCRDKLQEYWLCCLCAKWTDNWSSGQRYKYLWYLLVLVLLALLELAKNIHVNTSYCIPYFKYFTPFHLVIKGVQWLSGRMLDSRPRGCGFEPHQRHCVLSLSKNINPSLVLVQPRKACPFISERLLMGCKESNQTRQTKSHHILIGQNKIVNVFSLRLFYWIPTTYVLFEK